MHHSAVELGPKSVDEVLVTLNVDLIEATELIEFAVSTGKQAFARHISEQMRTALKRAS